MTQETEIRLLTEGYKALANLALSGDVGEERNKLRWAVSDIRDKFRADTADREAIEKFIKSYEPLCTCNADKKLLAAFEIAVEGLIEQSVDRCLDCGCFQGPARTLAKIERIVQAKLPTKEE